MKNALVEKLIGSETKAELLMFFHDSPDTTDTIEGIAAKVRRQPREIEQDVSDLVELGLLQEVRVIKSPYIFTAVAIRRRTTRGNAGSDGQQPSPASARS